MNTMRRDGGMQRAALLATGMLLAGPLAVHGQAPPSEPPPAAAETGVAASRPVDAQPIVARVIDAFGDVQYLAPGTTEWKRCAVGDEYPEGTQVRTGVRSSVKLQVGDEPPYTAVLLDPVGKTAISEAYKTPETKRVGMALGYGRIRAGVAEGGLKSDFSVSNPTYTLSKRGTWNFYMFYERGTERCEIGLLDRGLVQALNRISGAQRGVLPGERVTEAMRSFLDQAQLDRNVPIPDLLGQGDIDVAFNRIRNDGVGVVGPGEGQEIIISLSNRMARDRFAILARDAIAGAGFTLPPAPRPPLFREEGFFGSGRGDELVRVLIGATDPLVTRGFARPGGYWFRKSALETWMRQR